MHFTPLSSIVVPDNRQRQTFDPFEHQELVTSLESLGLLHPLVLRKGLEDTLLLVAGERRLRAIQDIYELGGTFRFNNAPVPPGEVPFVYLGELSPLEALEAEYEENIRRVDLSWSERAQATAKLTALRQAQAHTAGTPAPSLAAIGLEIQPDMHPKAAHTAVREQLIVARHLNDADVANAKSLKEARKIIARKEEARKNVELAEIVGRTFTAAEHSLYQGNCLEVIKSFPAATFDVACMDPPYGIDADSFNDSGGLVSGEHTYDDSASTFVLTMKDLPEELNRVLKPEAHLYMFCDVDWFIWLKDLWKKWGWKVFRTPFIWHKPKAMRAPWPEQGPQRKYETILYAVRGKKPSIVLKGDVLTFDSDENLGHNAQKPVALLEELLSRSCRPGERVIDPFCGSGSIFPAAQSLKLYATGIEQDSASYGIACKRLEALRA